MRGKKSDVGDTRIAPNGYHYTRTEGGWELTSRIVAGRTLGRPLEGTERVTFIDGDRGNLEPSNLRVAVIRTSSAARRKARLEAKVQEFIAEIEELDT